MTLTPDQLPARVSNFIAYGPEERAPDPLNKGGVITVRPQVYVRYYPTLVVRELKEGGRTGNREGLVTVHFDPASVGFKDPISAHMNSDDQTLPMLRDSKERGIPLAIGIETQRKKKNSETGAPISPITPIHALRGASHPNGDGDGRMMMGPSGNNTSNRVAFVNGQSTQHIQSNPHEWKALVNNKAGDLPPEGWRNFAPGDDWKDIGAAIRADAPTPAAGNVPAGAFPSADQLGGLIHEVVTQALREFAPTLADRVTASGPSTAPGRPTGTFTEGKPWDPRTSDGRINLGGYVVASERWVYEWAHEYLDGSGQSAEPAAVWDLTGIVHTLASEVQAKAYGHGFVPDRTSASHREAEKWVQWIITHTHPYPGGDADEETTRSWTAAVANDATALFSEAGSRAGDYFAAVSKRDKNGAAPTPQKKEEPAGPSAKVVRAYLDVIERNWAGAEALGNLLAQGRDSGYVSLPVSLSTNEDGSPAITYPPAQGAPSGPLESLLLYRLNEIGTHSAPAQHTEQQQDPTPAPHAEQHTAPEAVADAAETDTPEHSAPQGTDALAGIIARLQAVTDEGSLRSIFEEVRDANLTASQVYVAPGPRGEVLFGQEGQDGYQAELLGRVFGLMRHQFLSEASAEQSPTPQPQGQPDAQERPEATPEPNTPAPEPETTGTAASAESPDGEAQRLADAAGTASTLDELAELRAEADAKGLTETTVQVGGDEGMLGLWIGHQKRRISRAQRKRS